MRSVGKNFEDNWAKSCPQNILIYRPPDAAQGFNIKNMNNLRFSLHSPCDFLMFDGRKGMLWALELKTFGKSCSFERSKDDNGMIHYHQIMSLKHFASYHNVCSGLLLDFRNSDNTYFLNINEWDTLTNTINKKSFNEKDILSCTNAILIEKKRLRVNYRYNIDKFCNDTYEYMKNKM